MKIVSNCPLRVLIVEDDPTDAEFARRSLNSGDPSEFEVVWVGELSDAAGRLRDSRFDVVLLDLGLPGYNGLEALREIRQQQGEVPIIVLTALSDERVAMQAIDAGAQDYLVKGQLTVDSLIRAIRYAVSRQQLVAAGIQRELAVRRAENLQATMLHSSLDAIISIDHQGNVIEFNPAAESTFGFTRAEMLGQPIADAIIPPRYRQRHRDGLARYLATGRSTLLNQRLELTAIDREGTEFPIELAITRVAVADPPIFTAFLRDVSDRKRAEDALEERVRLATLTARVGVTLTRPEELADTLRECAEALVDELEVAVARIWTFEPQDALLELVASAGMYVHLDGPHSRIPLLDEKIGLIAQLRRPHLTNEAIGDPRVPDQEWSRQEGMVAFAGYPLIVDGRLIGVLAMFSRHLLKPATFDGMVAVCDQIAAGIERKRAEKSLRFTQFTIDQVATPVFWSDAEGRFFNVNNAACRLVGYTREELLALSVSDINAEITAENWPDIWNETRQRGKLSMESVLQRKDGTRLPISVDSNLLEANGRQFSCTFLKDITQRKEAERAQQQNELRFRSIYNHLQLQIERMPLGYILLDADLRVIDWNPAAETIFGYRIDEVLGMGPPFEKIVPQASRTEIEELLGRLRQGDMSAHAVNDNQTKDGRTIRCEWMNTPLCDEDGQFNGLMCLVLDVTERNRLEEQFRQAQKMEAVGALAGGVAHEFNNLLQAICGYTRFALEDLPPGEQRAQDLQMVLKSAERAVILTRQLLSFGRRQVLQRTNVDPNQVVSELLKMLRPLIGENIEVEAHLTPGVSAVYVDGGELLQVLLNLCINARDAMPKGGRLILRTQDVSLNGEFCAHHRAKPGPYVMLSVADNGSGMSAEIKAQIFEPFFTTKELGKGTGLGLAMVYGMVEQHGGIIHVYSEPGQGTTFRIYLPVAASSTATTEQPASLPSAGGHETILIAEDDPLVRAFLVRVLSGAGYTTLAAEDGVEALRVFHEQADSISLALLDVVMPNLGGRALYQRLSAIDPKLRVVFCSGHDPQMNQAASITEQGLPLLQKPVDAGLLLHTVRAVLDAPGKSWHSELSPTIGLPVETPTLLTAGAADQV